MTATESSDGGRGDATRRRLVEAAVRVFGENGYHAVGTRDLASAAGANQAAIPYYFGGKDGLHRAAAEHIAAAAREAFGPVLERTSALPLESSSRPALSRATASLFRALVRGLVGPLDEGYRAAFIVREQLQPGPAFDILYDGYMAELHQLVTRLVAAARGLEPRSSRACIEAHALIGAALSFVVARQTLCRRLKWDAYNERRVRDIEEAVVELALRSLGLNPSTPEERES